MLQIEHLVVSYDRRNKGNVLDNLNLTITPNEKAVIVGPNGSGKSTLFKAVLGLAPITGGIVNVFGTPASEESGDTRVSTNLVEVYQLVYLPVRDLIRIFAQLKGKSPEPAFRRLHEFELDSIFGKHLHELSTGQQKMFGNIMAASFDPKLVFLDEPFDNVDENRRRRFIELLRGLDSGIVVITHELTLLSRLGDWGLYFMLDGKLWGKFQVSQLDRLYLTRGESREALAIMDTSLGRLSVTLGAGDVPVKSSGSLDALLQEV
jgi:ABC-type multidrug transport system ATPase subunit